MSNTSVVYARLDSDLKQDAESILSHLGISPSSAIQMLYSQIILNRGLPFTPRIPANHPLAISGMSREQLDAEIQRGMDSVTKENAIPAEEVEASLLRNLISVSGHNTKYYRVPCMRESNLYPRLRLIQPAYDTFPRRTPVVPRENV